MPESVFPKGRRTNLPEISMSESGESYYIQHYVLYTTLRQKKSFLFRTKWEAKKYVFGCIIRKSSEI